MKKNYHDLSQGDLVYIDLNPTKGHEQRGKRPCIILSKPNKYLNYNIGVPPKKKKKAPSSFFFFFGLKKKKKKKIFLEKIKSVE
ncbi:type II toxin-antitoxin system PemK/MazF family toxin (plasmid) [Enterococcus faecium]